MAKKGSRRRFSNPRFGVTQGMVEAECQELGREFDSYLLQSLTELREASEARLKTYREQDQSLQAVVSRLPERERLAAMCILGRDLLLIQALFLGFLGTKKGVPNALEEPAAPTSLPFSEWLFAT